MTAASAQDSSVRCPGCGRPVAPDADECSGCGVVFAGLQPTAMRSAAGAGAPELTAEVLDGRWALEALLGRGGMGAVYRARDLKLGRAVALKLIAPELAADPSLNLRFEREAQTLARLEHPNLLPIYGYGRHGKSPFIVTKYLEGQSLDMWARARAEPPRPAEALEIARQLCAGLSHLHERGVVHRDLKPHNVFVGPDGHVTILDLGLVRSLDPEARGLTRAGTVVGTPGYMAPEQASGLSDVDGRADLYALGVTLFEVLTGAPPYQAPDPAALLLAHRDEPVPDASRLVPGISREVAAVLSCALAKRRTERFATAAELFQAFERACQATEAGPSPAGAGAAPTRVLPAGAGGAPTRVLPARAGAAPTRVLPGRAAVAPGRRRVAAAALGVGAVVALGAWVAVGAGPQGARAPEPAAESAARSEPGQAERLGSAPAPAPAPPAAQPETAPLSVAASGVVPASDPERGPKPRAQAEPRPAARRPAAAPGVVSVAVTVAGKKAWGELELDGKMLPDQAPTTLELQPGKHRLRALNAGAWSKEKQIVVTSGQPTSVTLEIGP